MRVEPPVGRVSPTVTPAEIVFFANRKEIPRNRLAPDFRR
jgi:hypothetical protein